MGISIPLYLYTYAAPHVTIGPSGDQGHQGCRFTKKKNIGKVQGQKSPREGLFQIVPRVVPPPIYSLMFLARISPVLFFEVPFRFFISMTEQNERALQ